MDRYDVVVIGSGANYQTMLNRALREYMEGQVEPFENTLRRVLSPLRRRGRRVLVEQADDRGISARRIAGRRWTLFSLRAGEGRWTRSRW